MEAMIESKKIIEGSSLLERYNNLKTPYQMLIFFTPFAIIVHVVLWGLISFMPPRFAIGGLFENIIIKKTVGKVVPADQATIIKNVDTIVAAINDGKSATGFKSTDYSPFCGIMNEEGELIVSPKGSGINLKRWAPYIYTEIAKGTVSGIWVDYPVKGKLKHVYVKKTKNNMFVTSGYFEPSSSPSINAAKKI